MSNSFEDQAKQSQASTIRAMVPGAKFEYHGDKAKRIAGTDGVPTFKPVGIGTDFTDPKAPITKEYP